MQVASLHRILIVDFHLLNLKMILVEIVVCAQLNNVNSKT